MQYKITSPVHRDGEMLKIGSLIDLKEAEAAPLLALGAIEEARRPFALAALNLTLTPTTQN